MTNYNYNEVMYEVNIRNYTEEGTFDAFEKHLPRLKKLGIDIIWLMPIHPISKKKRAGNLGSFYSISDLKAIHPDYGTLDSLKSLVNKAHDLGFQIILDWVANHTGWDHHWIEEHKDWYTQDESGNIISPREQHWPDVADLNYDSNEMRKAMIDAMRYWVIECDIDGYRCDYASGVPQEFWEEARRELESIKPVFMLAEDDLNFGFLDFAFQTNYNWKLLHAFNAIAKGDSDVVRIVKEFTEHIKRYPLNTYPLNFISNHDENAWVGSIPERLGKAANAMGLIKFTLPGMPLIDSGQEINLNKRIKFFDKDPINWNGWEENTTHQFYEKLTKLKKENTALWHNNLLNLTFLENDKNKQVLSYLRYSNDNKVIVITNLSNELQDVNIEVINLNGTYFNYLSDEKILLENKLNLRLKPWDYLVLISEM